MTNIELIVVGVLVLVLLIPYIGLISKKNEVENAFGGMDVQLKKCFDLIPNLISVVKQYMSHEKDVLTRVTELRTQATQPNLSCDQKVALENKLSKEFSGLMFNVENYPDLKSNENLINLQNSFNEIESQISAARRAYNAALTDLNNAVQMFPSNMIAGMMGITKKEVLAIPEAERKNVSAADLFKS